MNLGIHLFLLLILQWCRKVYSRLSWSSSLLREFPMLKFIDGYL